MNKFIIAATLAALAATPAAAVTLRNGALPAGVTDVTVGPNSIAIDLAGAPRVFEGFTFDLTAEDTGPVTFSIFIENFDLLREGIRFARFEVEGADFGGQGDVAGAFSNGRAIESRDRDRNRKPDQYNFVFTNGSGGGEYVSAAFGLVTPFQFDTTGLGAGDSFRLVIGAVPTPATLAIFGLGFVGLAAARRR